MQFYLVLACFSIAMIALVSIAIQKMFSRWKVDEANIVKTEEKTPDSCRPAVGMMITMDKCVLKRKVCPNLSIYDLEKTVDDAMSEQTMNESNPNSVEMSQMEVEKVEAKDD